MKKAVLHPLVLLLALCCTGYFAHAQQPCNASFTAHFDSTGNGVRFQNNSTSQNQITSTSWTFGDGTTSSDVNPYHTFTTAGVYYVCLTIGVTTPNGLICTDQQCDSVFVGQQVPGCQASFSFQNGTASNTVYFSNSSTGSNTPNFSATWDFGDNNVSTDVNPQHTYAAAGTYNVCLTITTTNPPGITCTDTYCKTIVVGNNWPGCQAYFSFVRDTASGVQFTDHSQVQTATYATNWDFGDGTTSTDFNPYHVYAAPGSYNVCLVLYAPVSGLGCVDTFCKTVVIGTPPPCVDSSLISPNCPCPAVVAPVCGCDGNTYDNDCFAQCAGVTRWTSGACQTSGCQASFNFNVTGTGAVYFNNTSGNSTPTGFASTWDFGDGGTSSDKNPIHFFQTPGTYYVCLTIHGTTPGGIICTDTFCDSITIGQAAGCQASFGAQQQHGSLEVHFNNSSFMNNTAGTSSWDFGDGHSSTVKNPDHTYAAPGMYYVCLTITVPNQIGSTCTSTHCDSVHVASVTPCIDQSLIDPNVSCPTVYQPVCGCNGVTYSNDCIAKYGHGVTQWTQGACQSNNCSAGFTVTQQGGLSAQFNNTSHGSNSGANFASDWDFGDNTTSTDRNPTHTYSAPGIYYVCLKITVTTPNGNICMDTHCDSVRVGQNTACIDPSLVDSTVACPAIYAPVCGCNGITYSSDCVAKYGHGVTQWTQGPCGSTGSCNASFTVQLDPNGGVHFTNTSAPNPHPVNFSSSWDFGDGTTSTDKHPHHNYNNFGMYYVCLTITVPLTNGTVCTSTYCDSVRVGVNAPCIDQSVINQNIACNNIYSPVCGCNNITYANSCEAFYHHGVTQWTPGVCNNTGNNCQAKFIASYGIVPPTVFFTDISTGGNVIGWHWDFGDGTSSTLRNPSHNFPQSAPYVVCLTITCASTTTGPVYVDTYCDTVWGIGSNVCVDASLIDTNYACPTVYQPVCGCDGNTYANACVAKFHHGVTNWNPGPCQGSGCQANFSFQMSNVGFAVAFTDLTQGSPTTWQWDFGDNTSSTDQNPVHTYLHPGTYNVCLTITSANNNGTVCVNTFCKTILISGCINPALIIPNAPCPAVVQPVCGCNGVTYPNSCIAEKRHGVTSWTPGPCGNTCSASFDVSFPGTGNQILFTNTSTGNFSRVKWTFGDGSTSADQNPTHVYDVSGWYKVCLEIFSNNNTCYSQTCDSVYATGCTDPSLINLGVTCPAVYQPVCGCDGQTYQNSCIAQYRHGVVAFTVGPCSQTGYCPTGGQDQGKVWIKRVASNYTGDDGGYAYFNQCQRKFRANKTYIVRLAGGVSNVPNFQAHWRVWFDFNHDNDFDDAGEMVWQGFGSLNQFAVFTIPSYACAGCTRMRITLSDDFADACGSYAVGETEDYDVGIRSNTQCHATPLHPMAQMDNSDFKLDESVAGEQFAELYEPLEFTIYPNPADEVVNLILTAGEEKEVTIRVFDISGKEVYIKTLDDLQDKTTLQLQTAELANGVYQVALQTGNGFRQVQKLIVAR